MDNNFMKVPFGAQTKVIEKISGKKYEGGLIIQKMRAWDSSGEMKFSKQDVNQCIQSNAKHILSTRIVNADFILTSSSYIFSLFLIIYSTITSQLIILTIGVLLIIPTIVHTVDGITRRWNLKNIIKKLN